MNLTYVVSPQKGLFVEYGGISLIWHVERPHVVEPNSPPCGCLLILKKALDRWLPELFMSPVSAQEHEREDILPSLGKCIMVVRVCAKLPNPVSLRDDAKWEAWTGIKDVGP